jgi:hypothetical protein
MRRLQIILGTLIILAALITGLLAFFSTEIPSITFYIWIGITIISRLHILMITPK